MVRNFIHHNGAVSSREVGLHWLVELFFDDKVYILSKELNKMLVEGTTSMPTNLVHQCRKLRMLVEGWMGHQVEHYPNQKHVEKGYTKIYSPWHLNRHKKYKDYLKGAPLSDVTPARDEDKAGELCRELIKRLEQGPSNHCITAITTHVTGTRQDTHLSTWSTTAHAKIGSACP